MITTEQVTETATPVAALQGFILTLMGTRLNGNGMTTFLWHFLKNGVTYQMQDELSLRDITPAQLPVWAHVFQTDMSAMVVVS